MRRYLKKILYRNHQIVRILLGFFIRLHNYSYRKITEYATALNHGISPKFQITKYADYFVDRIVAGDKVLDIGCGVGLLAGRLASKAASVVGVDLSSANILQAKKNQQFPNLEFIVGDATSFSFAGRFDKLVLSNVLEHIDERVALLKKLATLGEVLLLRVPLVTRDWVTVYKRDQGYPYRLDQTHRLEYDLEQLEREVTAGGWRIESYQVNWGEFWGYLVKI